MSRKRRRRHVGRFNTLTACISTTMVLVLLGVTIFTVLLADGFRRELRENFTVAVLLDDSISSQQQQALMRSLRRAPYARSVTYISKQAGTRQMMQDVGDPTEVLGASPVLAELEVFLRADYAQTDSLRRYMPPLRRRQGVADVVYQADLVDQVNHTTANLSAVLLSLAGLLAFVSLALINNTMSMSIHARRFSIRTMKLVGASWGFIRRPFMARAFWIGFTAAALADAVLYAGMRLLIEREVAVSNLVTPMVQGLTLAAVALCGLLLTLLCAFVSINRHLRMRDDQVYLG